MMSTHSLMGRQVQTALRVLFPPRCAGCNGLVDSDFGLCGTCWRDVPLVSGPICHKCGVPILAAEHQTDGEVCEDCLKIARPWKQGRAAMLYKDMGRRLVLGLKHGDRQDVAITVSVWLSNAARPLWQDDSVLVPVPLHWSRLLKRRYNQAALLAQRLAAKEARHVCLDGLIRTTRTRPLDGATVAMRFERLLGSMMMNPKREGKIRGKAVILVDDVMTSGATLAAATEACYAGGARQVDVLTLARVAKDT